MIHSIEKIAEAGQNIPPRSSRSSTGSAHAYWIAALAVVLLCILYHRVPGSEGFPLDDGYISLHSAQVLHWGKDPNFPTTAPLAGITNAPYVLILYLLLFALPPLVAMETASWLGILCYSLGLVALSRAFRLPWWATTAVVGVGLVVGKVPYHLLNGVETGLAMGLTVWIFALTKNNTVWSRRGAAVLCGLVPFLRPELIVVSGLVLAVIFLQDYLELRRFALAARRLMPLLLLAALSALPWMLWYGLSTGTLITQSIEAKRLFYSQGCYPSDYRWALTLVSIRFFQITVGYLILSFLFLLRHNLGRFLLIFVPVFFFAYYERFPGALSHNWGRYLHVLIPLLMLGLISGLGDRSRWLRGTAYGLLVLSCLQTAVSFSDHWSVFLHDRDTFTQQLKSVANWSNDHLPSNSTVLIHDAGYISYATKFKLVDLVGLKTPSSIEYHREFTNASCGEGRAFAFSEIARHAQPQYLIAVDDWDTGFRISAGLREQGWGVDEIAPPERYHVYRLTPPKGVQPATTGE